jgi:PAS domain S-box-containing protein
MALEIAERRRAERDLRAAEERYRSLVEEVPAVVYTWQLRRDEGGFSLAYANPQVHRMLGYTPDEWIEGWSSWVEQLHPHDRERVLEAVEHSYWTGEPFEAEYRYLAKDGRVVWVVDRATLLTRTEDGEPFLFQGVMIDVTAQKEAERKAVRAEERFRELAEEGPVVPYSFRVDHAHDPPAIEVDYVSPQAAALLGLPPTVHGGMEGWLSAVHPHDRELFVAQAEENLAGGAPWVFEYRTIDASGTVHCLEDRGSCVARDEHGRPVRFVGVLSDVTARRLREEAADAERATLRAMTENLPAVPWAGSIDTATGGMRLAYVGPQVRELLGVTPEELLGNAEPLSGWIHPEDRARAAAARRAAAEAEAGISHVEYRVVRRDGSVRWVRAITQRSTAPGETPQIWNGLMIDVTSEHPPTGSSTDEGGARSEPTPLR